tara:strand:+ start:71 stop:208 length:138 start_codon:yes stop_codon:yes gene_type:complete
MNEVQLQKLIKDQEWAINYHSDKLIEAQGLMALYTETLAKLIVNE